MFSCLNIIFLSVYSKQFCAKKSKKEEWTKINISHPKLPVPSNACRSIINKSKPPIYINTSIVNTKFFAYTSDHAIVLMNLLIFKANKLWLPSSIQRILEELLEGICVCKSALLNAKSSNSVFILGLNTLAVWAENFILLPLYPVQQTYADLLGCRN